MSISISSVILSKRGSQKSFGGRGKLSISQQALLILKPVPAETAGHVTSDFPLEASMAILERILRGEFVNPATVLGAIFYAVLFLFLASLGARSLRLTLVRLEDGLLDRTTARFLRRMGLTLIWVLAIILYAHLIPELRSLGTALLTGASVASIVIGIAAQSTLGNLVAGVSLLLYRPFRIGDSVQLTVPTGLQTGTVEDLNLGYTVITTKDKNQIVVPNSVMASQAIVKSGE